MGTVRAKPRFTPTPDPVCVRGAFTSAVRLATTEYKCDLAIFELYHQTGNIVLLELLNKPADAGVLV
jgi:hypothetical protein